MSSNGDFQKNFTFSNPAPLWCISVQTLQYTLHIYFSGGLLFLVLSVAFYPSCNHEICMMKCF